MKRGVWLAAAAVLLAAGLAWRLGWLDGPARAASLERSLADYRAVHVPEGIPPAWRQELAGHLASAPSLSLQDDRAAAVAREFLAEVSWVDPASVRAEAALPDGIRVSFRPRTPVLRIEEDGDVVGLLAADGVVLPAGGDGGAREGGLPFAAPYPSVPLARFGRATGDPALQEALDTLQEFLAVRRATGLDLAGMQPLAGFPPDNPNPPPMVFVTRDGKEILWGNAASTRNPLEPVRGVRLRRLKELLSLRPGLEGVRRVVLDSPLFAAFDDQGRRLPESAGIP